MDQAKVETWMKAGAGRRLHCGDGLYLVRGRGGGFSWAYIWMRDGVRREHGLGRYEEARKLREARWSTAGLHQAKQEGKDIIKAKREERKANEAVKVTFADAAAVYVRDVGNETWKGGKGEDCVKRTEFERIVQVYCKPLLKMLVQDIQVSDVKACLEAILKMKKGARHRAKGDTGRPTMVKATASVIRRVLDNATGNGWRPLTMQNPASDDILSNVIVVRHKTTHFASLPWEKAPAFYAGLGDTAEHVALRLLMLTALRRSEVLGLLWSEVDLDAGVLRIAAERMKAGKEHVVPLSGPAMALLVGLAERLASPTRKPLTASRRAAVAATGHNQGHVFPSQRRKGQPLGLSSLTKICNGSATPHGMRATFRTWVEDNGHDETLAEHALAHQLTDSVQKAYRRSTAVERRRELMQAWADHLTGTKQDEAKAA